MNKNKKRKTWQSPWGYLESFIISSSILIIGFIIEFFSGDNLLKLPAWPVNLILIVIVISYIIIVQKFFKTSIVKWFSSPPAAISAISILTFLILLMGFIPQNNEASDGFVKMIGLTHVTTSWPYLLCSFFLLLILGFTIVRRLFPLTIKNFAFFLNHAGLFIVIVTASLGSADLWRLNMQTVEGRAIFTSYDHNGNSYNLPFAIKLLDFKIKEYPPNIGLYSNKDNKLKIDKKTQLMEVVEGSSKILDNWNIIIEKYLNGSKKDSLGYDTSNAIGAAPAAYVKAVNQISSKEICGWVSCGSFNSLMKPLVLTSDLELVMTIPVAREYSSDIRVFESMKKYKDYTIKVNEPLKVHGWTIYQTGYNEKMGKWSNMSIIELVNDPWLPAVYVGIFMLLTGSLYLVWMGRSNQAKKTKNNDLV
ncbi:MAG: cytochrome c biogenesis protein ResB [Bacteroidales bacterium]|nr:cytochrome c biogenesis protein ResB [Bacteroidales bacterium]